MNVRNDRKNDVALVADVEYFEQFYDAGETEEEALEQTEEEIHNLTAIADNSLLRDTGVTMRIARTDIFPDESEEPEELDDSATSCGAYLTGLENYRDNEMHLEAGYGSTHLFTGRNELTGCFGLAQLNQICHERFAVSLRKYSGAEALTRRAWGTAHELAHVYSARHDHCSSCGINIVYKYICDGGTNDGEICGTAEQESCAQPTPVTCPGGSCVLNPYWQVYVMVGGAGNPDLPYSSCSKLSIINRVAAQVCSPGTSGGLAGFRCFGHEDCPGGTCDENTNVDCIDELQCGDVMRDGDIDTADALVAFQLADCGSCPYTGLVDVHPYNNPDGDMDDDDATVIQEVALGLRNVPPKCGNW